MNNVLFESNVIYIGTKTVREKKIFCGEFESNVIYIGTKTIQYIYPLMI